MSKINNEEMDYSLIVALLLHARGGKAVLRAEDVENFADWELTGSFSSWFISATRGENDALVLELQQSQEFPVVFAELPSAATDSIGSERKLR